MRASGSAKNIDPVAISIFDPGDEAFRRILEGRSSDGLHGSASDNARGALGRASHLYLSNSARKIMQLRKE